MEEKIITFYMNTCRNKICPVCGSTDIGLWNSRKQTFHCHECDSYFTKYGSVIMDNMPVIRRGSRGWNGFTDPDNYPTDGYDNNGW